MDSARLSSASGVIFFRLAIAVAKAAIQTGRRSGRRSGKRSGRSSALRKKPAVTRARREDERGGLLSPLYGHNDGDLPCVSSTPVLDPPR